MDQKIGSKFEEKVKAGGEALEGASAVNERKQLTRGITSSTQKGFYCDSKWWVSNEKSSQEIRLFDYFVRCRIKREVVKEGLEKEIAKAATDATSGSKVAKKKLEALNDISKVFDDDPFYK
mgnify:FL=1